MQCTSTDTWKSTQFLSSSLPLHAPSSGTVPHACSCSKNWQWQSWEGTKLIEVPFSNTKIWCHFYPCYISLTHRNDKPMSSLGLLKRNSNKVHSSCHMTQILHSTFQIGMMLYITPKFILTAHHSRREPWLAWIWEYIKASDALLDQSNSATQKTSLIVFEKRVTSIKANSRERTGTKGTGEQNSIFQWWIAVRSDQMQWKLD